ncbi:MAG: hypothetical protein COV74_01360 [Candidatus Omnitrophica bacterium CG11_big_fil_rev_8_21_14_0_20_45_26]|uniref:DUF4131 domain-containing protein n=1 Tax=Candidatus Abzuiibacterium crystallinum TaxID=1974748 RepID=A0A2H0LS29_9BACT|nr:MAG: hypothetical protein COV74_01360 [Candidatus Omnitrophica bacterium CG11_big_fil_rev_8_21_14_0_20_45_26]PIW64818.1 MAG: hypothetical protein COW12_04770 [Candidatus Omnitrophica bacterium CG12_big_fil_rev_8_21_14_0_65_45_16]
MTSSNTINQKSAPLRQIRFPLLMPVICYSIGTFIGIQSHWHCGLTLFMLCVGFSVFLHFRHASWKHVLIYLAFAMIGFWLGQTRFIKAPAHVKNIKPQTHTYLRGQIISPVHERNNQNKTVTSFTLQAKEMGYRSHSSPIEGRIEVFLINAQKKFKEGQWVELKGALQTPKTSRGPHEFDYAQYLEQKSIFKTFFGIGPFSALPLTYHTKITPKIQIQSLRSRFVRQLDDIYQFPINALVSALLIGIRKDIPQSIRDHFVRTGTAHSLTAHCTKNNQFHPSRCSDCLAKNTEYQLSHQHLLLWPY